MNSNFDNPTCVELNKLIQHAYNNSDYYKFEYDRFFSKCPSVKSKEDFLNIPFTDGKLIEGEKSSDLIAVPEEEICYIFFSGGTNGSPKHSHTIFQIGKRSSDIGQCVMNLQGLLQKISFR